MIFSKFSPAPRDMRDPTNAPTDVDGILSFQGHGDSPFFLLFFLLYVRRDKTFRQVQQSYSRA